MEPLLINTSQLGLASQADEACAKGIFSDVLPPVPGRRISLPEDALLEKFLPRERQLQRYICRSGILGCCLAPPLIDHLHRSPHDPFRIGLYGSFSPTSIPDALARELAECAPGDITAIYRRRIPPNLVVKSGRNIPLAQLGTLLGASGPLITFPHWESGVREAVDAAEIDFVSRRIDLAIVVASYAIDNPLVNAEIARKMEGMQLCEGAAALVLRTEEQAALVGGWLRSIPAPRAGESFFGHAHPLFSLGRCLESGMLSWK